jgi:hypothetical protein
VVVAVTHAAVEHVRHGLEAAVRMIGKSRDVVLCTVRAEFIEHEEWIEIGQLRLPDYTAQLHARAI